MIDSIIAFLSDPWISRILMLLFVFKIGFKVLGDILTRKIWSTDEYLKMIDWITRTKRGDMFHYDKWLKNSHLCPYLRVIEKRDDEMIKYFDDEKKEQRQEGKERWEYNQDRQKQSVLAAKKSRHMNQGESDLT